MSIVLPNITNYLSQLNWNYQIGQDEKEEKNDLMIADFKIKGGKVFSLIIQLDEEGEYILFQVPHLLKIDDSVYKGVVLQTMALIAHQLKMVRLEYCPVHGEVLVSIEIPLEDNHLTQKQFDRCVLTLVDAIEKVILPRLTSVITTGNDSGMPDDLIQNKTIDIDSEVDYLYNAIAMLKNQESSDFDT